MTPEQREELRYAAWDYRTNPNPGTAAAFHRACKSEEIESLIAQVEALTRKEKALQGLADLRYAEVLELTAQLSEALTVPQWISVEDRLPPVGTWCTILVDRTLGDYWDRLDKPLTEVYGAQLREVDSEGYAYWQRWQMADGGPMGSQTLVSHWMPLPAAPTIPAIPGTKEGA